MFEEEKNLKVIHPSAPTQVGAPPLGRGGKVGYTKTDKLITALYMVTDIMDSNEPLRAKLRTLSLEILSDTFGVRSLDQILSFLNLAQTMNLISEMNVGILKKEFLELKNSLDLKEKNPMWLEEFLAEEEGFLPPLNKGRIEEGSDPHPASPLSRGRGNSKGHLRIGVQKGGTLMQALSDKMSDRKTEYRFDLIKKERREKILSFIKEKGKVHPEAGGATISDIKIFIPSYGEKTLQRELVSMVKDKILDKKGEKRWSKYFVRK